MRKVNVGLLGSSPSAAYPAHSRRYGRRLQHAVEQMIDALRLDKGVEIRWISPGGVHAHVAPGAAVSGYGYDSSHVVFVNGR